MKKHLRKKLLIMLIVSILVGVVSYHLDDAQSFASAGEHFGYVVGYVGSLALFLILSSFLVALIPFVVSWMVNAKRAPNLIMTAWYFWIAIVTIIFLLIIYGDHIKPSEASQSSEAKNQTTANSVYTKVNHSIHLVHSKDKNNHVVSGGSAVAVSDFLLATNCHVINDGHHFTVFIGEKEEIGHVYSQHGDLCIISAGNAKFPPTEIRQSKTVEIGEDVYAIGNPEGLEKSISRGIISNKYDNEGVIMLQTDAAISPGSSGGGLFDHNGKLIGITTAKGKYTYDEGIGFVIPTETIQAAILEPTKQESTSVSQQDASADNIQNAPENSAIESFIPIGTYGESKIDLMRTGNLCVMVITGRSEDGRARSSIIWTPYKPNLFFIFPTTVLPTESNKILSKYFNDKNPLVLTQNYLFINKAPYQLSGEKSSNSSYKILTAEIDINPIKIFIDADYFIASFSDEKSVNGYSMDYYGLRGFSEALAEYHGHCEQ